MQCPACQTELPADSRFCGYCGFRLAPISLQAHQELSQSLQSVPPEEPIPLTRVKRTPSEEQRARLSLAQRVARPRLEIVEDHSVSPAPAPSKPQAPVVPVLPPRRLEVVVGGERTEVAEPRRDTVPETGLEDTRPDQAQAYRPTEQQPAAQRLAEPIKSEAPSEKSRRFPRFPLKVEVNFTSEHNFYTGFIQNIGGGGLFVATHEVRSIGDVLEITFSVPGLDRTCTVVCQVRWVREFNPSSPDGVPGMGLSFSQLDPEARAAIELFFRHREPIFFDDE